MKVGKNENPIATKIVPGRDSKPKDVETTTTTPKVMKKEENKKKDVEKKETVTETKKTETKKIVDGYDTEKLKSLEKELKTKLTRKQKKKGNKKINFFFSLDLDSVIESVTKERDDVRKYLQSNKFKNLF